MNTLLQFESVHVLGVRVWIWATAALILLGSAYCLTLAPFAWR